MAEDGFAPRWTLTITHQVAEDKVFSQRMLVFDHILASMVRTPDDVLRQMLPSVYAAVLVEEAADV